MYKTVWRFNFLMHDWMNQFGTESPDVVTGISVNNSDTSTYPDTAVGGYTEGSLAGSNGETVHHHRGNYSTITLNVSGFTV